MLWTLIATVGLLLAVDALVEATRDRQAVDDRRQGLARLDRTYRLERAIARGDVAGARWLVLLEVLNVAVGVLAMFTPAPPAGRTPAGWAALALLIAAGALVPLFLLDRRRRRRRLLGL